jgi:hypothetical protein
MTNEAERRDLWGEAWTDRLVCQAAGTAQFVLDADRWSRIVDLLDRVPQGKSGLVKLFSKPSLFSAA